MCRIKPAEDIVVARLMNDVSQILSRDFYLRDVVEIARGLLGMHLCTRINNRLTKVLITETEAYAGVADKGSHAYGERRTKRTEPMFAEGGVAYVYLCYGIHHLFNVVTNIDGTPHAVLVRAGDPLEGVDVMLERRKRPAVDAKLLAGPGTVAQALGITTTHSGLELTGPAIWIESGAPDEIAREIIAGPRIGIDYAEEDALLPYRFRLRSPV